LRKVGLDIAGNQIWAEKETVVEDDCEEMP
jgi:hypothetical protein